MFTSEETLTQEKEMETNSKNEIVLDYQQWTPQQGDYKKYNAAEDKQNFERKLKKDIRRKILLAIINAAVITGSLIYFL